MLRDFLHQQPPSSRHPFPSTTTKPTLIVPMKHQIAFILAPVAALALNSCVVEVPQGSANNVTPTQLPADNGGVPQNVINDCLATLRGQVGNKPMTILNSRRGESSFIVDVQVGGVPKPWRCYHDGTKCTGTEYQGEG